MPTSAVLDCACSSLTADERAFFRDADPWGFILFARHCESPDQLRALCHDLRSAVSRDAPILIDQEGGRVQRMRADRHGDWLEFPPLAAFGELWKLDPGAAGQASWLGGLLLGRQLKASGISVNCTPMLDLPQIDSDPATLGDRAFAMHPDIVVPLARAHIAGLVHAGVIPVIKHLPGLGRALCDSHTETPVVVDGAETLRNHDFRTFTALKDTPLGMTAHVVYKALDADAVATTSKRVIESVIRGEIGFAGLLLSDDLKMEALGGSYADRASKALSAGCDIALACNLDHDDQVAMMAAVPTMGTNTVDRAEAALGWQVPSAWPESPWTLSDLAVSADFSGLCRLLKPIWSPPS